MSDWHSIDLGGPEPNIRPLAAIRAGDRSAITTAEIDWMAAEITRLQGIVSTICDGAECKGWLLTDGSHVNSTRWVLPNCDGVASDSLIEAAEKARET